MDDKDTNEAASNQQQDKHDGTGNGTSRRDSRRNAADYNNEDCKYDWGPCGAPKCCSWFNRIEWVLVFWCLASFSQSGYINGTLNAVLTTLQQRYQLSSTQLAVLVVVFDAVMCLVVLLVSYHGGNGRKPRWVGLGCLLLGIAAIVFALPQFIFGPYVPSSTGNSLCTSTSGSNNVSAACSSSSAVGPFGVLVAAQALAGAGASPLYTLGYSYLHENVKDRNSALYISIFMTTVVIGPAAGLIITSVLLNFYVDLQITPTISTISPLWVGAWWVPFLIFAALLIFFVFPPVFGFPKVLPATNKWRIETVEDERHSEIASQTTKALTASVITVLKNSTFIFVSLASACHYFCASIITTFGSKLMQDLFNLPAGKSALFFGVVLVPAAALGTLVGGVVVKRHNLTEVQMLHLMIAVGMVMLPAMGVLEFGCARAPFAGLVNTYPLVYPGQNATPTWLQPIPLTTGANLTSQCNAGCSCSAAIYKPVCGSDNVMYYSPCFAGCISSFTASAGTVFYNCSCIQPPVEAIPNVMASAVYSAIHSTSFATDTTCSVSDDSFLCRMPVFLVLIFVTAFMSFMVVTPTVQVLLRCVPPECSSVVLGMNSIVFRVLGVIPGPLVAGAIIDSNCYYWRSTACNQNASCVAYDLTSVKLKLMYIIMALVALQIVLLVLARILFRPVILPASSNLTLTSRVSNTGQSHF